MSKSKTRFISIKNEALLDGSLKAMDKFILMILENRKLLITKSGHSYTISIRAKKLKGLCHVKDNRTLLSSLNRLKKGKYIKYEFNSINNTDKMNITIDCSPPFTLVDEEMFDKLCELNTGEPKPYAIVSLYFILEHYHNPNLGGEQGLACPSRDMINSAVSIRSDKLTKYFTMMHDELICEFAQGKFFGGEMIRTRNRYLPNSIKHKKGESEVGLSKRRYKIHKRKSYFDLPDDY